MIRSHNPPGVAGPFAGYSHGVEIEGPARILFGAGQVGVAPDGRIGDGIEEQARLLWDNVGEVLAAAGMGFGNIVQLNMLLVDREDYPVAKAERKRALGEHRPASTLMYVVGLSHPEWRIEIDFVAALSS